MNKNFILSLIIIGVLLAAAAPIVRSQSTTIYIKPDGSISGTDKISQNGNSYLFLDNITGTIVVQRSNIILDGAGYTLEGYGGTGIDLTNNLTRYPSPNEIQNVTIQNLSIMNFNWSINGHGSSYNTFYNDYIGSTKKDTLSEVIIYWNRGGYNITHCTFTGLVGVELSSGNIITGNNLSGMLLQLVGNETIDRNYWNDYTARYPNASETGSTGIGDTPYVIDVYGNGAPTSTVQDNHPLMKPISTLNVGISSPTIPAIESASSNAAKNNSTSLSTVVAGLVIALITIGILGISVYAVRKQMKHL